MAGEAAPDMPPLLRKTAYFGGGAVGVLVVVKLMMEFAVALKPLVLATMFVACLEFWVDRFEHAISLLSRALCIHCPDCPWKARKVQPGNLQEPLAASFVGFAPGDGEHAVPEEEPPALLKCGLCLARPLAVLSTLCLVVSALVALSMGLVSSVRRTDLTVYKAGFVELQDSIVQLFKRLDPDTRQFLLDHIQSMSDKIGGVVASTLNQILDASSGFFTETVMFLIYTLMWLLVPMRGRGEQHIFKIVRTFFALKAACNLCFAILTFLLLKWLNVDLALIIAVLSFVLGFIPEVGAILAVVLPVPVVILDSRLPLMVRYGRLAWTVGGLLLIKFGVSNGLESVVMGRNPTLAGIRNQDQAFEETHPVLVLFAVVLLGEIWGPTGMLVSVPMISMLRMVINLETNEDVRRSLSAGTSLSEATRALP